MIYSVSVTNEKGEELVMELAHPEKCGIIVKEIENLGLGEADVNINEMSSVDGGLFSSSRVSSRSIKFDLAFMFDPTIEDVRQKTYQYFNLKKKVKLRFNTDNRVLEIEGYVKSNEPDIFSKEEGCEIEVVCPYPFFKDPTNLNIAFAGALGQFEFPFSNESLEEPLIEFGIIHLDSHTNIKYVGEIDIGAVFNIHMLNTVHNLKIFNINTLERVVFDDEKINQILGSSLSTGDDIYLSTVTGNKYCKVVRNGIDYNIIGAIGKDADWFKLSKGDNIFAFDNDEGEERNLIMYISYSNVYGGI